MRNQFEFYGKKAPTRREIQKPFLVKAYLPDKNELNSIITTLWQKPQREYQLFAQELVSKYAKNFDRQDLELLEYMVTNKSWWDTVDFVSVNLMGQYFKIYPDERRACVKKWLESN